MAKRDATRVICIFVLLKKVVKDVFVVEKGLSSRARMEGNTPHAV